MKNWIFLCVAIIAEVIATSALKSSEGFSKPIASVIVVLGFIIAFYCLSLTLKTIPVGIAYAIWSGVGIVLVTTIAWIVFGQKLDVWGIIGIALIMSGVLVLNLLSKTSSH
ncbi:multidrug efflux SMR transporter [Acinetobacter sp. 5862]|uniref:DMT family transporter n=1 Tax=Acinetobacter sp. 5862 TaxID=2967169 RepID=UPI0021124CE6|nr:multidrug efflux SMR transporter [Acinetobacter sp. 5862]